jgi:hypothetical protein
MAATDAAGLGAVQFFDDATVFLFGAFTALVLVFLGRAAFGLLRPMSRLMRAGARRAGVKTVAQSRAARAAAPGARNRPGREHLTAVEWALTEPDDGAAAPSGERLPAPYDFGAERRILRKQGQVFKWLRIPAEYIPKNLVEPFSDSIADEYLKSARRFFARPVSLRTDESNFYEDEEGAVLVALFRDTDRRCFYALDQMRRVINANALRLTFWLSALLLALTAAAWASVPLLARLAERGPAAVVGVAAVVIIVLVLYVVATFTLQAFYANSQRQNMREFSDFLTRYLGLIANRFREASAKTSRVIQGDERDSKVLAANAQKWHKIMIWLGLRPFFLESFVRNVYFQVRRNLTYYAFGSIFWFVIAAPLLLGNALTAAGRLAGYEAPLAASVVIWAGYFAFAALSIWQLLRRVVLDELNQMNWLGYDNLEVGAQMDEVIGKYAEDIGLWKGRFDR